VTLATAHAPPGGIAIQGQQFTGGEFIPAADVAKATESQKKAIADGGKPPSGKPAKTPAKRGAMAPARREGKGRDARLVLADGSPAPAHVAAGKIPPQWKDVTVSLDPDADVLATGRDAAGRAKVIYRDEFHMRNAAHKFARTRAGLEWAGELHKQNQANRADPKLREEADCTWLMQEQATRPGSDKDTAAKVKAFGATTLRAEHVVETGDGVRLQFVGKEGVYHDHLIRNPDLAQMLLARKATAGSRGGKLFATDYDRVAKYAKSLDTGRFTPKDFRTIRANQLAIAEIGKAADPPANEKEYKARVKAVAERVSGVLGNRPAQALESYIDPAVFSAWKVANA
jgi:DNA topoisomerase I